MKKRKRIIKQMLAWTLCMVLAVTLLPVNTYAAETTHSGNITTNITWEDGDVVDGVTIAGGTEADPIVITVNGTVTVKGPIQIGDRTASDSYVKIVGGENGGTLKKDSSFSSYDTFILTNGTSYNYNLTLENITLDGNKDAGKVVNVIYNDTSSGTITLNKGTTIKNFSAHTIIQGNLIMEEDVEITGNELSAYILNVSGSQVTMNGGEIWDNTTSSSSIIYGSNSSSTLTINDCYIHDNTISYSLPSTIWTYGTLIMNGGKIENNSGMGVKLTNENANFTMTGGTISKCGGNGVDNSYGKITMTGGTISECTGYGVYNTGGTFNIQPKKDGETATVTIEKGYKCGIYNSGTMTIAKDATVEIKGNTSSSTQGGIENGSTLTIQNGAELNVSDNKGRSSGGIGNYGTMTINQGAIVTVSGNEATSMNAGGFWNGGILTSNGTLQITDNKAATFAGGMFLSGDTTKISGKVIVSGNTANGVEDNVALVKDKKITITDALDEASEIGVNMVTAWNNSAKQTGTVTSGYGTNISTSELKHFSQDDAQGNTFAMVKNASNEVEIKNHTHQWKYDTTDSAGNVIKAYCTDENPKCKYYGTEASHPATVDLTLTAGDTTYSGSPVSATFGDTAASWEANVGSLPTIQYQTKDTDADTWGVATGTAPTDVGIYKAVVTVGTGDDAKTVEKEFRITPVTIVDSGVTLNSDSFVVAEAAQGPTVTVKATVNGSENTLSSGSDYEITGDTSETSIGNYSLTVTGKGNYTGTVTKSWSITKAPATVDTAPSAISPLTYTGGEQALINAGSADGGTMEYRIGTTGTWSENVPKMTNAGSYDVYYRIVADDDHYSDEAETKITVSIAKATQTIAAPSATTENTKATKVILTALDAGVGATKYAVSTTNTAPTEESKWQESATFTGLTPNTDYYFFAKYVGDANHEGVISTGTQIKTNTATLADVTGVNEKEDINPGIVYDGAPVTLPEIFTGTPALSGNPGGEETPSYKWAKKKPDGTYEEATTTAPTDVGNYKLIISLENDDSYGTKEIEFQIVKRDGPTAPTGLTSTAATSGLSDGTIGGLDPAKQYEYSTNGVDWTSVPAGSSVITGVPAGTVQVREQATDTTEAGTPASVVVKTKQEEPTLKYAPENSTDGQVGKIGIESAGNVQGLTDGIMYEYTTDISDTTSYKTITGDGTNYIPVDQLGVYYVRAKETDTLEASQWVPVTAGIAIVSDGMVSNLSSTEATLTAIQKSTSEVTVSKVGFQYRVKGTSTWMKTEITASINDTFSSNLTGLVADTEYEYQAYAESSNGTIYGKTMTFHTSKTDAYGSITIKVTNENTSASIDIVATIEKGNTVIASADAFVPQSATNTIGPFANLADGTYNVVVRTKDGNYTETNLIIISNGSAAETTFSIPTGKLSTTVDIKGDTPDIAVGGLNAIITDAEKNDAKNGVKSVDVQLVAEKKAETEITTDAAEIKKQATGKTIDTFLDLSIFKTTSTLDAGGVVVSVEKQNIGAGNEKVLEIAIPYPNITKTGLTMYKCHNGIASSLTKLDAKPDADSGQDGSFYLDTGAKYIYLYAKQFSTYAIAYTTETPTPETPAPTPEAPAPTPEAPAPNTGEGSSSGGGGSYYYPVTGITVTSAESTLTKIGETLQLTANISPDNASDKSVTWSSDNEAVAKVDNTGKVTAVGNGTATITATTKSGNKTAKIVITVNIIPAETSTPTAPAETEVPKATETPMATVTPKPEKVTSDFGTLKAKSVKQTNTAITLSWTKLSDADGYMVYGSRCNSNGKKYTRKLIKTIKGNSTLTWTQKKLDKATYYKYQIKAYKIVDGKKVIIAKSVDVHAVTKSGKYCMASAVKVNRLAGKKVSRSLKLSMNEGRTAQITASEIPAEKGKTIHNHRELCYESSDSKVAVVTKSGKIKAVGKGKCEIWVYAQNGVYKTITVTVK